jgi:hypothetical protein
VAGVQTAFVADDWATPDSAGDCQRTGDAYNRSVIFDSLVLAVLLELAKVSCGAVICSGVCFL